MQCLEDLGANWFIINPKMLDQTESGLSAGPSRTLYKCIILVKPLTRPTPTDGWDIVIFHEFRAADWNSSDEINDNI